MDLVEFDLDGGATAATREAEGLDVGA